PPGPRRAKSALPFRRMNTLSSAPVSRKQRRQERAEALWLALAPVVGRLTLAVLAAMAAMYVFVVLAHDVAEGDTRQIDVGVLQALRVHRQPWLDGPMFWISWAGGPMAQPIFVCLCLLGLALGRRFWPDGLSLLLGWAGGNALIIGLKRLFHRPRPEVVFDHLGYSFPSGHSFFALVVYGMVAYWLARDAPPARRRWIWAGAITATLLMGFSRMYLGEHYPSDVAAGFAVGLAWLWGCLALPKCFHRRGHDISLEEKRARYREGVARLREAALFLPNLVKLATRLARDPRVPRSRKLGLGLLALYLSVPFDLIPDFIPVLGVADDLILVSITLAWVAKAVPAEVLREHWDGDTELPLLLERTRGTLRALFFR
ncbi:MAG TPA: phosphatase PAP2 family protein, partial [Armatimonadota bacterium]|nr:phosphatase PAP2 family protein [Armatimonadota bacterium]